MYQFKVLFGGGGVYNLFKQEHHESFITRHTYQNGVFIEKQQSCESPSANPHTFYIAPLRISSKMLRDAFILEAVRVLRTVARLHRARTHAAANAS